MSNEMDRWPLCYQQHTKNYQNIMSSLDIIQQGHDEYAAKGKGLLTHEIFDTFLSLKLAYLIFAAAEQFSINLQAKDTTVIEGIKGAKLLKLHYVSMRTDESFSTFYLKESEGLQMNQSYLAIEEYPEDLMMGPLHIVTHLLKTDIAMLTLKL